MNAETRRKIEMGGRALKFSLANPDTDPGAGTAVTKLEQLVEKANDVAAAQRGGLIHARAATARKHELRRAMLAGAIGHLSEVGGLAARDEHELAKVFRVKPDASTFLAFRTAARGMATAAEAHKETLVKYGLSPSVVAQFGVMLDEYDAATALGNDGRAAHIGATRELRQLGNEIARTVRVMDARNRQRFAEDAQQLGAWLGASRVQRGRKASPQDEPGSPEVGSPPGSSPAGSSPAGSAPASAVPGSAPVGGVRPAA